MCSDLIVGRREKKGEKCVWWWGGAGWGGAGWGGGGSENGILPGHTNWGEMAFSPISYLGRKLGKLSEFDEKIKLLICPHLLI